MSDAPESTPRQRRRARQRADFDATVADIEAQVRATNAKIEAHIDALDFLITGGARRPVDGAMRLRV